MVFLSFSSMCNFALGVKRVCTYVWLYHIVCIHVCMCLVVFSVVHVMPLKVMKYIFYVD